MPKDGFDKLYDRLDSLTVGFSPIFREFQYAVTGYPPHNIVQGYDNNYVLELAVAGFKREEIAIEELKGVLTITGTKTDKTSEYQGNYQFRGIGQRSFTKSIRLAEYIKVVDAKLADGLLSINLQKNEPEADKPKVINIF